MQLIQKGETVAECHEAVKLARKVGFHVTATFIFGFPTETHEDRMASVRLAKISGLEKVRFNNAIPYPGTKLFDMAKADGGLRVVGRYDNFITVATIVESPFSAIPSAYVPPGTRENVIKNDILFGYLCFYLNARRLLPMLFRKTGVTERQHTGKTLRQKARKLANWLVLATTLAIKFSGFVLAFIFRRDCAVTLKDLKLFLLKIEA
jgi:radical SAM superfamily enzyme YgiQ (UPF0313 family)